MRNMKHFTVRQLKELIEGLSDDAPVIIPGGDHSYRPAHAIKDTALFDPKAGWTEDHGEEMTPEAEFGSRLTVLIVE